MLTEKFSQIANHLASSMNILYFMINCKFHENTEIFTHLISVNQYVGIYIIGKTYLYVHSFAAEYHQNYALNTIRTK